MKKISVLLCFVFSIFLLSGCGDKDIYGDYTNPQFGVVLKIKEKVIDFKGMELTVESWEHKDDKFIAHTRFGSGPQAQKFDMELEKKGNDVVYLGALFKRD
jgi:hypothetical protein